MLVGFLIDFFYKKEMVSDRMIADIGYDKLKVGHNCYDQQSRKHQSAL